jgi:hypothetical protein
MSGHEAATGPVTARIARDRAACTPADLDAVRFEVARFDVLAQVALEHFDRTVWREIDDAWTDFVAHLVAATAEPPPRSHHRGATTEQPSPSSHHRAAITEQPPPSSHHRAATTEQPPPSSHHRAATTERDRRSCRTRDLHVDLTLAGTRLNCCAIHKLHRPNPRTNSPLKIYA